MTTPTQLDYDLHGYSFNTPEAKERIAKIVAAIKAAPSGRISAKDVAILIKRSPSVGNTYMAGMVKMGLVRKIQGDKKNSRGAFPADYELCDGVVAPSDPEQIVRRVRAEDYRGSVPVDPMRQYLFGDRVPSPHS